MLQRAVALLLQRLLGKFVSFDSSMLRLSLWQGDLSFQDLQLRLSYGEGSIGHLSVKIPWRALWTQAVVIKAHNIRIFLHQAPKSGEDVLTGLVDDDSTVGNTSIDGADGGDIGDDRTYLSRLVAHIIANVQIELSDVQVRYDCTSASLAERPGSATLEVGFVSLINTNSKWELEFTPQSNASMESRKLLKIEGVAAYIEYEDRRRAGKPTDGSDAQCEVCREYLFHDWYSTVKASLFYHSSNASFPDVELDVDVGSGEPLIGESCSVCRACDSMEKGDLPVVQPRIHFGAEHIDVLYAILIEVKAPYEEYDRLAALTQQQASRPEGFLMVLAYAKQWLLSDCLDGVAGETYTLAGDSDDDDDDEFEDAITPPSLSVRAGLRQGVSLVFFSRESGDATPGARNRMWAWVLGHTWASVRQSCVEDELQFMIQSLKMLERSDSGQQYRIIDHIPSSVALESPFLFFKCIVPAYQSRLVGHQPVMDLQMKQKTVMALKDETLVLWMTLFAPVYLWWTQWNLSHPSKLIVHDEARIAPISNMSVDFENIQVLFSVHERFCFGVELTQLRGATGLSDDQKHVVSHFQSSAFRVFSATQALEAIQSAKSLTQAGWLHEILVVNDMSLLKTSHSRTNWSVEAYVCTHGASSDATQHDHQQQSLMISSSNGEETAMYNYQLVLPPISIDWRIDEIEALSWVIGKWIFFLPDNTLDLSDKNLHLRSGRAPTRTLCSSRWSISVPELKLRIIEDRDGKYHRGMFELFIRDLRYENRRCSATSSQRVTISTISLRGGKQTLFAIEGNARLSTPAVNVLNQVQRYYSEDAQNGDPSVLYFVGEVSETSVLLERTTVVLFLPLAEVVLKWLGSCYDRFNLGFILSTSYGYDFEHFRGNLVTLKSHASMANTKKSAGYHDETLVNVLMSQGWKISILHQPFQMEVRTDGSQLSPVEIGAIECSSLSLQSRLQGVAQQIPEIKGTVRNLQVRDLAIPDNLPSKTSVMPNRQFIGSNQSGVGESVDMGPFGLKNVVDFVVTSANDSEHEYSTENQDRQAYRTVVRVRLDSVCLIYLHRVFKQFQHYVADHVLAILADPFDRTPSSEKALDIFKSYEVNVSELPASIEDILKVYFETFGGEIADDVISAKLVEKVYYELVANDLTFILPRNSFSTDSIILHCTNARFWSAGVDSANSDFLQNGSFGDESRLSHSSAISDANMARAQQTRRTELRNVKRLVKNQRSRLLSNRSQLYIDLKNATQQAQNYLHEGFEAFPEAEEAVKIIHHKIVVLDQQLDQLAVYLKEVEDAIEVAKAEGDALNNGGRDSIVFMASTGLRGRTTSMVQSEAMDRIKDAVASMSQSLMTPLFIADNAEFHDARTTSDTMAPSSAEVDMSTSSMGLFEFELVDLSGTTSNSKLPLFHHALLTGRIETELESLSEVNLSSYFGINLAVNELSVGASPEQYTTLLGAIYENFKEVSSIVDEDTYPLCKTCHGHHYDEEFCNAIWMRIPVKVADAALRVSNGEHSIADMFWEQLELVFILRTDDSLELNASALSFNAIDVRPTRCPTASEIIRPLPGDGLQVVYNQKSNWTDSVYSLKLNNTNCLLIYPAIQEAVAFFLNPIFREGEFFSSDVGFMGSTPPDWKKMDFHIDSDGCLLSLLEEFGKTDSRALVVLTDIALSYSTCQNCEDILDMKKCHFSLDQRGIYFSQLPDLQIDASFPLSNAFQLVVDHFVEGSKVLHRRNSFVLAPVETRFSVQDGYLFINIVNNYLHWFSSVGATAATSSQSGSENGENGHIVEKPVIRNGASAAVTKHYAVDKLLGDVGELRLVLVNNSLGIPIADFQMREIVCEYVQDEECSTVVGGILSFNYFNNSIYRWEPLVEPFVVQVRVHRALEENSRVEVFANLPNTVNFNITPAMAPLLSTEALKQADFVTTGSKSTAPFWIQNNTGMDIKFSFRRGKGNIIQQDVPNDLKVSVDCRERGDMRSFDSTSADRFLRDADRNALTVNHTLSVWLNGNKWVSANPVVVDVVGHVSVPLREVINLHGRESLNGDAEIEEDLSPPILVAEITIQPDGSKLISLHSQIVLQNRTSVPLMVWAFSPRDGGCVQEWIIDREQLCHVPLKLIHPQSKISIRPSPYVQYAPLATSLEELGDEVRVVKSINTKRFIRSGNCVCNFETFATPEELRNATNYMTRTGNSFDTAPLSGYVVRDLPTWKCTYDVEAYYLMRATFSAIDETKLGGEDSNVNLTSVDEEEQNEKVEDDFRNVFSDENLRKRVNHPLSEVNYELDEARNNNQRRGLYEATNSSLFYLSVSPFVTLHNRLATAVAYRLLNGSLQLIAEGILAVGNVLPLFQIDSSSLLYISFRLENYNWSTPKVIINPKSSAYSVPYKDLIEPVELQGRVFDRDVAWEQGNVPNLQLQVKLSGRDVIIFCSVWIVNHSDLDLEYCNSTSSSNKRLESVLKYVHRRHTEDAEQNAIFSTRNLSFHDDGARDQAMTRLQKVKAASNPVALIVVIKEAKDLYNAQYFGAQSPYVRASLYVLKNPQDRYLDRPEMQAVCTATTKPSPSGGLNPKWDARLQNTLLLRFPEDVKSLELARVIVEVRNVRYGMDTCLGVTAVKLDSITKDRKSAASFNWYKLLKRKSSKSGKGKKAAQTSVHRGDVCLSFSVGSSQEVRSELDAADIIYEVDEGHRSPSIYDEERPSLISPHDGEFYDITDEDASAIETQTPGTFPSSAMFRSMHRLQTPASESAFLPSGAVSGGDLIVGPPGSIRARQGFPLSDLDSTRTQQDMVSFDPLSTRSISGNTLNGGQNTSPRSISMPNLRPLQVYLPQNRFALVVVNVHPSFLLSEIFELVCLKCGFHGVLDVNDFDFYELALPRFVSLRSAGRPEGDRWYGHRIPMESKVEKHGRQYGLHLCHKMTMTTIRLYDESSTASTHHVTPRSLLSSSKKTNPAQNRPMAWGEVLAYGSGGKNWDVLRVKSQSSPWSEVIRLNRNAMGNSGVAQVFSLANEVYDQDQTSDLRKGNQEIALWSSYGTGRFSDTIIATIVPRYILINRTGQTVKYRQLNVPHTFRLGSNDIIPFHWPSAAKDKLMEVTLLHGYTWSGSFRIHSIGTTYLKLRDSNDLSRIYILQCQIEMVGGSIALVFREESKRFPPYRIDNMTSFRIQYKQTNWGSDRDFDELQPRSSCPYSWDQLNGGEKASSSASYQDPAFSGNATNYARSLQVRFMRVTSSTSAGGDSEKDAVETRDYNLDEMTSHRRIQLQRSLPSQLFINPEHKGYLLKKDNLLKWNKKYFRLYENMLYYFANENDQELLGVVDLRTGSDVPGAGSVAIFEKAADTQSKGGFMSLNGLVSSISGTIFGSSSRQLAGDDDDEDNDDEDERARDLVQLAVGMTTSTTLCEESEKFVERVFEDEDGARSGLARKGFYVNGESVIAFLVGDSDRMTASQAFSTAQEMLILGVLKVVQMGSSLTDSKKSLAPSSFRSSKSVWYSVNSISLADDTDSIDSEDDTPQNGLRTPSSVKTPSSAVKKKPKKVVGSAQFSIITATKCYDLKAKTPRIAKLWVKRLRNAARGQQNTIGEEELDEPPTSMINSGSKAHRAQKDIVPIVQHAKTYVHVRIRADGPTKVLEIFEGGEEDFDEKESKHELSSAASAASESPTASETSTNAFEALTNGISINLRVDSLGISCVNELPMELVYIYFAGINVHYTRVNSKMRLNMTLDDVQVDNQSSEATFNKLLCPRTNGASAATTERKRTISDTPDDDLASMIGERVAIDEENENGGLVANEHMFSCADCKYRQLNVATTHFCCTWSNEQGTTDYFEHCSFWLHPVISQLDEELLVAARAFLTAMMQSLSQNKAQSRGGEIRAKSIPIEMMTESLVEYNENTMSDDLNPLVSLHSSTATSSTEVRKVYFALLHIHPIEFDITYRSDVFQAKIPSLLARDTSSFKSNHSSSSFLREEYSRTVSAPASSGGLPRFEFDRPNMLEDTQKSGVAWAIPSLTMHVPDLDNAPVRLNALMIEHAFGTSGDLTRRVSKYYTRQLWKQLHKILGSFDFLGNPVGFLDHIGTGVRDFVYEPLEGLKVGGKGFSKGLAKGTASLVTNTLDGTFDAASKISGTFGQGLATMSLDDHYQQIRARARRHHVRGIREGLIQGSKELSLGMYEGVAGLVLGPMRGAQENGALGFVKGTITGIIGLPVKPVAGIFDFASRATQGVRNRSLQNGQNMRRVRRPRVFGRYNELKCYKEADTIAYDLLKKTGGAKLSGEKIIFYNEIIQSVLASELTKQARDKRKNDSTKERTRSFRRSLNDNEEKLVDGKQGSERKLIYEVTFYQKKLGLDLETDFYCENVTVKAFDESSRHHTKVHTTLRADQKVLQEGDCLITVGGVDVRGIGFEETLGLLRGTSRPIKLQFESCDEQIYESNNSNAAQEQQQEIVPARARTGSTVITTADRDEENGVRLKVQLTHWLIVTEQRALYINVSSFANPIVEWMTPLRYIYRVEWLRGSRICLHLSVGVDSLPTGPRSRPSLRALDSHERDMNVFLDVMWQSFKTATAEEQELWPSDTSLNGFLMKKGGFTTVKRWFVLSRNCLYYFSSQKELRGIIPLGSVRLEADSSAALSIRITNEVRNKPLVTLQMDNGQVVARVQSEIVLLASSRQDFEMWQSSLAHAAGKGLRNSRGTRFFVPTAASRLEVGTRDTPDFVVAPLAEALKKTVEMFNIKLP